MKISQKIIFGVLAVVLVIGLYVWTTYNRILVNNENVNTQWSQVEAQYQRRFDLIPNLVESVRGILQQEQSVFIAIAEARTRYSGAVNINDKVQAANQMESALSRLLVIVENYPQLQSYQNVQDLMAQLEGTENRVSVERMRFNEIIRVYNLSVKRFPSRIVAGLFAFDERTYFEAAAGAETAPRVDLDLAPKNQ
ncbi:LemA family protein [Candidatus Peregrinibacteria bacterium]|nr:LemA family protein [Candidatus Peregrinibacteria bacterium]